MTKSTFEQELEGKDINYSYPISVVHSAIQTALKRWKESHRKHCGECIINKWSSCCEEQYDVVKSFGELK